MEGILVAFLLYTTVISITSQATVQHGTVVYPEVYEERGEDSEKFLSIHEGYTLRLRKASVLAPRVFHRDETEDGAIDRYVDGNSYEKHLYTDTANQASLLVKPQANGNYYEIMGLINFTHIIHPLTSMERSLSGRAAHRISKIALEDGIYGVDEIADRKVYAKARATERKATKKGDPPQNFTLELFLVSDVEHTNHFETEEEHLNYLTLLLLSVSLRLRQLRPPGSIAVTGFLRLKDERKERSYIELRNPFEIYGTRTQYKLQEQQRYNEEMRSADGILLFTARGIKKNSEDTNKDFLGFAYVGGACSALHKALVVKDMPGTFSGTHTGAHEVGHFLGSPHDGEGESKVCRAGDGYLMNSRGTGGQLHKFSICSVNAIREFLRSENSSCLKSNKNYHKAFLPNKTEGIIDGEKYCKTYFLQYKSVSLKETIENCIFRCELRDSSKKGLLKWTVDIFAPDGTTCDVKNPRKKCTHGLCMQARQ
ncbi:venom metalloproteinase antarease-like TtrivMP_A [Dermacentor variabilis]|uniref:venom metalloproteinase antarease-like TtrivMP_A n=1 Tax=Dermacentor variabilis TaxID=34621 RepID=UPI003F5AF54F